MTLFPLRTDTTYLLYSFHDPDWVTGGKLTYLYFGMMDERIISWIDYITLEDGNEYKVADDIIQGIGSKFGILGFISPWPTNGERRLLAEYSKGGQVIYKRNTNSIENVKSGSIKVYTNSDGQTFFILNESAFYNLIELFDIEGRLVYSKSLEGQNEFIVPGLSRGLYLYKIQGNGGEVYGKFTVLF